MRTDRNLPLRVQSLLRERSFGGRDRQLYRELLYTAVRHLPWFEGRPGDEIVTMAAALAGDTPATLPFKEKFAAAGLPAALRREDLLPAWLREECPQAFEPSQLEALNSRAPLWLRLQTNAPEKVFAEFQGRGWPWEQSAVLPGAVRMRTEADITATAAHRHGLFEVQDLGSQMILESIGIEPGGRWLDACAGAGGKTLQLARLLGSKGRVDACDIRPKALAQLRVRARRGGFENIGALGDPPVEPLYDGVLVDAPCSGAGAWRRAPHLKWRTTPGDVASHAKRQQGLLDRFSRLIRPDGRLVYATCSLCRSENEGVVSAFLAANANFTPAPFARTFGFTPRGGGLLILPAAHDTDGFFVSTMRRA